MIGPEIIEYKQISGISLHVHAFRPDDAGPDRRYPAIVLFFCGGWNGFNATKLYPQSEYLAARGMICLNAEVRVKRHGTGPETCVTDAKSAVRWARADAAGLGIDPQRLAVGGGSAAGMVTGCLGTVTGFDDPQDDRSVSAIPDALVMLNPVCDMISVERRMALCGGPEPARALSPVHHVKPGQPPALVMHPKDDATVPVQQSIDFCEAMQKAGNRCELELWEKGGHGWFNWWDGKNPWFYETLERIDRFFISLGWLSGEPAVKDFTFHHLPVDPAAKGTD